MCFPPSSRSRSRGWPRRERRGRGDLDRLADGGPADRARARDRRTGGLPRCAFHHPRDLDLAVGLVVNAAVVAIWIVSRTAGLPIGPEPGTAEPAAFLDVLSTILEIGIVVVTAALLVRGRSTQSQAGTRNGLLAVGGLAFILVLLTTVAVGSEGEDHAEHTQKANGPGITHADLGQGRQLQTLVDSSSGATQVHFTFFDAGGDALAVKSVEVTGVSQDGEQVAIPVERFEPGHWAATVDLESGEWEFEVLGRTAGGEEITASVDASVP